MIKMNTTTLIVNFGGPRHPEEIEPFLCALLTDRDVIRTRLPLFLQNWMFRRVAKKRALKIREDYALIGGSSPIFADTEALAACIPGPTLTFHRYLPATHGSFVEKIKGIAGEIRVFPLFPQFSYATTGSIARWFEDHLPQERVRSLRWIPSYCTHPAFIRCSQTVIRTFLTAQGLKEEETILLFSAHGLPQQFILDGDIYESECCLSFAHIKSAFPKALPHLAYQSKFGRGEWLRPYTDETCENVLEWHQGRKNVVFVPLSFTSDHIETLFEIEHLYLPIIRSKGLSAYRCPALGGNAEWMQGIGQILQDAPTSPNHMLVRSKASYKCKTPVSSLDLDSHIDNFGQTQSQVFE
jgi:ferrochelatase